MKQVIVTLLLMAVPVAVATPASATKPARGCGRGFTLAATEQVAEILHERFPDASDETIQNFLDTTDANNDQQICYKNVDPYLIGVDNTANH